MYCSNCGVKNDEEARFCTDCGTALEGVFAPPPSEEATTFDASPVEQMYDAPSYNEPAYGAPPMEPVYSAPPAEPVYGAPPAEPVYGAPPAEPVYGAPPAEQAYSAPPTGASAYGGPPVEQAYGAPPLGTPYGVVPPTGSPAYGAPPMEQPTYGAPPMEQPTYGVPPMEQQMYGAPPPVGTPYGTAPVEPTRSTTPPPPPSPASYAPQTPYTQPYAPQPNTYAYGSQQTPPQNADKNKNILKIVLPIAVAVVLLGAFACIYFFTDILPFGRKQGVTPDPPPIEVTPTPTPAPTPIPVPTATPVDPDTDIPSAGGELRVMSETEYPFTPNASGYWEIRTSDNGSCDPYLQLRDVMGELITDDDDGAEDYNSVIVAWLEAGTTYSINAKFYYSDYDEGYTLSVKRLDETSMLPGDGGEVAVKGSTLYLFTPDISGFWEFRTSENGNSDPVLKIADLFGEAIGQDDDGGGDSNALLTVELDSEQTYVVHAKFYSGIGSYIMTYSYIGDSLGGEASGGELPSGGGETIVAGATVLTFSPSYSGIWEIRTSDEGSSDPYLELYNSSGDLISENDDGLIGKNAVILASMQEGEIYTVKVGFRDASEGDCIVRVWPTLEIPEDGWTVHVDRAMGLIFQPEKSGLWEFRTSNNYECDPYIFVHSADGVAIAMDDDSADDAGNALLEVELEVGQAYIVFAEAYYSDTVSYDLTVTSK
ncbi:MAG: zinc-ribbon domain-containing protein [Oscillospiraceae bacterium]|nr:zinc-ribbon domain-containing protein [Oscillospiraceae bacterium]